MKFVKNSLTVELQEDPDLLSDVLSALSKRIQSGMNLHRSKLLDNVPKIETNLTQACFLSNWKVDQRL